MIAACLTTLAPATRASAQHTPLPAQAVTAAQFLDRVRQENPQLVMLEADVDVAVARARAAGLWSNPSIAYDREEVFEAGQGLPENSIRLELPLEISGRRSLLTESAERGVSAARADAKVTRVAFVASATRAYLEAAARRERSAMLTDSRDALATLRDSVRSRASAGDASGYDYTRVEIELSSLDALVADAERELVESQLTLGMLAGRPGLRLDASDGLTAANLASSTPSPASTQASPRVEAARARVSRDELAVGAAGRGWIPSLTLIGGAKTAAFAGDTAWGYVAGVALVLPVFDHGQADKQTSEAALRGARASLLATEHQSSTRISMAQETFNSSVQQATIFARDQLPRLEQLLRRAEASYKEGERPVFELLDAHRTYREVRLRALQLTLQARLSHIELLEALGREPGGNP